MISIIRKPYGRGLAWSAWCVASIALTSMAQADVVSHNVVGAVNPLAGNTMQLDIVEVPIPAAIAARNNNALDGFSTYDFVLSTDDDLRTVRLEIVPKDQTQLEIWNLPTNDGGSDFIPTSFVLNFSPEAEYDTYVDVPGLNPGIAGGAFSGGLPFTFGPDAFSATWFVPAGTDTGPVADFAVARITLKVSATPGGPPNASPFDQLPFFFTAQIGQGTGGPENEFLVTNTPEPASLSLLVFGSLLLMGRRRA